MPRRLSGAQIIPVAFVDHIDNTVSRVDRISEALPVIQSSHREVHDGTAYSLTYIDEDLGDDATIIFALPAYPALGKMIHIVFSGGCGGNAILELLENPTITGGTNMQAKNMNRCYADGLTWKLNPTLGGTPTTLAQIYLFGGSAPKPVGIAGGMRADWELVLYPTRTYAIRLTNNAGNAQPAQLMCDYYVE